MANALLAQLQGSGMVPPDNTDFTLPPIEGSKVGVTEATTTTTMKKKKSDGEEEGVINNDTSVGFCYLLAAACASLNGPQAAETSAAFWRDGARELRLQPTKREKWAMWADDAAEKQEFISGHLRIKDRPMEMDSDHKEYTADQVRRYRKAIRFAERMRAPEQIGAYGGDAVPTEGPSNKSSNPTRKTPAERLKELELSEGDDGDDDDDRGGRSGGRKKGFWKDDKKKNKKEKDATKHRKNKKKRAEKKKGDAPSSAGSSKKKQKDSKRR